MLSVVLRQAAVRSAVRLVSWMLAAALMILASAAPAVAQQQMPPPPKPVLQPPPPPPPPPPPAEPSAPATDILKRGELFGDWGGARTKMGQKGTKIDVSYTQFFDWVPVGDDDRGFDYGGKFDVKVQSNLSKLLWEGFSADRSLRDALR